MCCTGFVFVVLAINSGGPGAGYEISAGKNLLLRVYSSVYVCVILHSYVYPHLVVSSYSLLASWWDAFHSLITFMLASYFKFFFFRAHDAQPANEFSAQP